MRSGSCPRQQMPAPEPARMVWGAISPSLPIVLALILLSAMAFATPPDPSWIAGIYDGADGDDIVSLVYQTSAASAPAPSPSSPLPCLPGIFLEGIARIVSGRRFTPGPRSPPILSFAEFAYVFSSLPPPARGTAALAVLTSVSTTRPSHQGDRPALRSSREHPETSQPAGAHLNLQICRSSPSDDRCRERFSHCPRRSPNNHSTKEETS